MKRLLILFLITVSLTLTSFSQKNDPIIIPDILRAEDGRFKLALIRGADPTQPLIFLLGIYDSGLDSNVAVDFIAVPAKNISLVRSGSLYFLTVTAIRSKPNSVTLQKAVTVTSTWKLRVEDFTGKASWTVSYLYDDSPPLPVDYAGNFIREGRDFSASGYTN
jgi:hypothetical protein